LAHFRQLIPGKRNENYVRADPSLGRWKPLRGFSDVGDFRTIIDSMDHAHVIWRPYKTRRDVTLFQDLCLYSRWILADKARICRHLPERVLRQYCYVQTVPRAPTMNGPLEPKEVVMTFMEFVVHVLSQQERGNPVPEDEVWKHSKGYTNWFYKESHPLVIAPGVVPDYTTHIPP